MGSPGGGYDTYTRALIAYLEKQIGAKLIPTNEPGAGGMIAMNRMLNAAPDGLTMLLTGGEGLVTAQLYGLPGVNYDVRKLIWLARVGSEAKVALLGPKSPYNTVADMQADRQAGDLGGLRQGRQQRRFLRHHVHALDVKCKIIVGYGEPADMNMAIQRGEVDGRVDLRRGGGAVRPERRHARAGDALARKRVGEISRQCRRSSRRRAIGAAQARLIDWRAGIAESRPRDPDDAGHAAGARRPAAHGVGRGDAAIRPSSPR